MNEFLQNVIDSSLVWVKANGLTVLLILVVTFIVYKFGGRVIAKLIRKAVTRGKKKNAKDERKNGKRRAREGKGVLSSMCEGARRENKKADRGIKI